MVATNSTLNLSYPAPMPMALSRRTALVIDNRAPVTAEDIRIHAWINDRLAAVHREQNSLRAKIARLFFGDRSN